MLLHIPLFQALLPCWDLVLAGAAPNPLAPAMILCPYNFLNYWV